jgi:hypothetical protein
VGPPGFALEPLAEITHPGAWCIGALATPGLPEMHHIGRVGESLVNFAAPAMNATPQALTDADTDEVIRTYFPPTAGAGRSASTSPFCNKETASPPPSVEPYVCEAA